MIEDDEDVSILYRTGTNSWTIDYNVFILEHDNNLKLSQYFLLRRTKKKYVSGFLLRFSTSTSHHKIS